MLNMDFRQTTALHGVLEVVQKDKAAVMNAAQIPIPALSKQMKANLGISQYRKCDNQARMLDDLSTFLVYPVFDSFDLENRQVAGILATNIYWSNLFSRILPGPESGLEVVVSNSFNQTFTYHIGENQVSFVAMEDVHDPSYDAFEVQADVNSFLQTRSALVMNAYTAVQLNDDYGKYEIRVYPSETMLKKYFTNKPIIYTVVVLAVFAITSLIFVCFTYFVEKRQNTMRRLAVTSAEKVATTERELNDFLAHEVRNPLAAAMSASTFVSSAVNEDSPLVNEETRKEVREDMEVVTSSLQFINDFLRSMLDIHRSVDKELKITLTPIDLIHDVLQPVSSILYKRNAGFEVIVDGPQSLMVMGDCLRLKQVVLNLSRNSCKFVVQGFIRLRADVVDGVARIYVEDSGPGIPPEKYDSLFSKYQASLDTLGQGTGIGLCLSKQLITSMRGDIYLDKIYHSGVDGCPGSRFVIELGGSPLVQDVSSLSLESNDPLDIETDEDTEMGTPTSTAVANEPSLSPCNSRQLPEDLSILFVDDDVVLRKLFMRAARKVRPGWKISEAASGESAVKLCMEAPTSDGMTTSLAERKQNFDIIFRKCDMIASSIWTDTLVKK